MKGLCLFHSHGGGFLPRFGSSTIGSAVPIDISRGRLSWVKVNARCVRITKQPRSASVLCRFSGVNRGCGFFKGMEV